VIQLYTWDTPNGKKVSIMLEEIGVPYEVHPVNLRQNDQMKPEYLAINPNNKIPAIIDTDGPGGKPFKLFESGAILMYLAEKSGILCPQEMRQRYEVIQWLMFQMGGVGPMFGQANFFFRLQEKVPYAIERFRKEALRLYNVSTRNWAGGNISRANIRSPISPPIPGCGATRYTR
jgi:GST-like protein